MASDVPIYYIILEYSITTVFIISENGLCMSYP